MCVSGEGKCVCRGIVMQTNTMCLSILFEQLMKRLTSLERFIEQEN